MLREPYGLNPYNTTKDTSFAGGYSFIFSGDELESFKIELAENNTREDIQYISDYIHYPGAYNNSIVNFSVLPTYIAYGEEGRTWRQYRITLPQGQVLPSTFHSIKVNGYIFSEVKRVSDTVVEFEGKYYVPNTTSLQNTHVEILDELQSPLATYKSLTLVKTASLFFINYNEQNGTNYTSYKIQMEGKHFDILGGSFEVPQLTLTIDEPTTGEGYISFTDNITYTMYSPTENNSSGYNAGQYFGTVGKDLIWRLRLWENNAIFRNNGFIGANTDELTPINIKLNSYFQSLVDYAGIDNLVGDKYIINIIFENEVRRVVGVDSDDHSIAIINRPFSRLPLEGEVFDIFSNFNISGASNFATNFIKNGYVIKNLAQNKFEGGVFLPLRENGIIESKKRYSIVKGDNLRILSSLTVEIPQPEGVSYGQITGKILEIGRNNYNITNAAASTTPGYAIITVNEEIQEPIGSMNEYVIYLAALIGDVPNYYIETTYIFPKYFYFGMTVNNSSLNRIIKYTEYEYSDGDMRGYLQGENNFSITPKINQSFKIYSNFINSSWYFFKSRKTPVIQIVNPPYANWDSRLYTFKGSYYQENTIPIKSHRWTITNLNSDETDPTIYDTGIVYTSNLEFTYDMFSSQGNYRITLEVTNQEDVVTSTSININTLFTVFEIDAKGNCEIDDKTQSVKVSWLNSMMSEPVIDGEVEYNNDITNKEKSIRLDDTTLTYTQVAEEDILINRQDFAFATGFVVEDDLEYYNSDLVTFSPRNTGTAMVLQKRGMDASLMIDGIEYNFVKDTNNTVVFSWLKKVFGQQERYQNYPERISNDYIWKQSPDWHDEHYWTETTASTDCYYYEFIFATRIAALLRYAFVKNESALALDSSTLRILYTDAFENIEANNIQIEIGKNKYIPIKIIKNGLYWDITIDGGDYIPGQHYSLNMNQIVPDYYYVAASAIQNGLSEKYYDSIRLGSRLNVKYMTLYAYNIFSDSKIENIAQGFGESRPWDSEKMVINCNFDKTVISALFRSGDKAIVGYKVYRNKYSPDGTLLYTKMIAEFDLEGTLSSLRRIEMIDWTVGNRGIYDYSIIPLTKTIYSQNTIYTPKIHTEWYGWTFTSIGKIKSNQYVPIEQWLFELNLTTNGYTHQTNKVYHQGFNSYPKVSVGLTDYITTNVSCLLGDLENYTINSFFRSYLYNNDSIDKIDRWREFSNSHEIIMVKDMKGGVIIGSVDGNTFSFQDVDQEILTTLSFNITQIDSINNYRVFSTSTNLKTDE